MNRLMNGHKMPIEKRFYIKKINCAYQLGAVYLYTKKDFLTPEATTRIYTGLLNVFIHALSVKIGIILKKGAD